MDAIGLLDPNFGRTVPAVHVSRLENWKLDSAGIGRSRKSKPSIIGRLFAFTIAKRMEVGVQQFGLETSCVRRISRQLRQTQLVALSPELDRIGRDDVFSSD